MSYEELFADPRFPICGIFLVCVLLVIGAIMGRPYREQRHREKNRVVVVHDGHKCKTLNHLYSED